MASHSDDHSKDASRRSWPEGGLPHGEHPYDYGYGPESDVKRLREVAEAARYVLADAGHDPEGWADLSRALEALDG